MTVIKRKQIVVLSLVTMILVAGYVNYSYKKSSVAVIDKESRRLGEAVFVDTKDTSIQKSTQPKDKAAKANVQTNDFIAKMKLDRDIKTDKDVSALKDITKDKNASEETKKKAYDQIMKISKNQEVSNKIENLINEKGYSEVLALFGEDGSLDIYVKSQDLNSVQVAQISDIASRQANIQISNIHIKNVNWSNM